MICLDADVSFPYAGNTTQLSARTMQHFPDLALLDQEYYDGANIAVQQFINDFQSGYCIITMPSYSFGPAFKSGNKHHVRVKLLNLISHMLFDRGQHVGYSKWKRCKWSDRQFMSFLNFRGFCHVCILQRGLFVCPTSFSYSQEIFVDLRLSDDYGLIWLNLTTSQPPPSSFCRVCNSTATESLHPQPMATPAFQAR